MPRVVHVTTTDISLALLLGPQLEAFGQAGYEVIGASAPGPWVGDLAGIGVTHVALRHATRSVSPSDDARALPEVWRLFRRLQPDIVHTHNPKPGIYGRIAGRAAGVPAVVNTVHGLYATPGDRLARRAAVYGLERLASTCSDAELVQNSEDLEVLARLGVPRRKLHLLGNGVALSRFGPPDRLTRARFRQEVGAGPDTVLVGAVGRLVWEKGYRELFAAAATLRERMPDVLVVVAGPDDPDKPDGLTAEDVSAAETVGVRFLGLRRDVEDVYAGLDLYVLASHREGFPRSAMEAAATGIPIIATDIRGCRQVVDHGVTGLLVPVGDASALAGAVATLARDADRRRAMGRAAVAKAEREFDERSVIETTLAVYGQLLCRSRTGTSR